VFKRRHGFVDDGGIAALRKIGHDLEQRLHVAYPSVSRTAVAMSCKVEGP
jgi:hypothetical protein